MSSSITTTVPSGLISTEWCIQDSLDWDDQPNICGNSGKNPSDYGTICCDGDIVDTASDIYRYGNNANSTINLDTLVCCRVEGPQQGGLQALATDRTKCTQGSPTPLASFAATNTANAAVYEVTYTHASESADESTTVTSDYIPRQSPKCLWVYTKTGVVLTNVTVAAADITTLPAPTTDRLGFPITTGSLASSTPVSSAISSSVTDAATSSSSTASTGSASGIASVHGISPTVHLFLFALGLYHAARF